MISHTGSWTSYAVQNSQTQIATNCFSVVTIPKSAEKLPNKASTTLFLNLNQRWRGFIILTKPVGALLFRHWRLSSVLMFCKKMRPHVGGCSTWWQHNFVAVNTHNLPIVCQKMSPIWYNTCLISWATVQYYCVEAYFSQSKRCGTVYAMLFRDDQVCCFCVTVWSVVTFLILSLRETVPLYLKGAEANLFAFRE